MSLRHVTRFTVEFGDCDPAQIVFYPNFFRFMDAASRHFFEAAGIPAWHEVEDAPGLIGTPLVEATARFRKPASYGDEIEVETAIVEWRRTSFVMSHIIRRRGETLVEGQEVRVFACRDGVDPKRIRATEPPASIRTRIDAG
jgi:4-hydroxybenzoyl-CoA thioesterase